MELCDRPAHALHAMLARDEITATDITDAVLCRIKEKEEQLHCYLALDEEGTRAAAQNVDQEGVWAGIPVAVADNICTEQLPTTAASRMLAGFVSPYEATVVQRGRQAGMIVVGKSNLDEFGWGYSTQYSAAGPTYHPWDQEAFPGGAQGGAAAAVASGEAVAALATDTGGSLRQPAARCGLVGLKPTYGRISRHGVIATASSLDQVGTITKDVKDAALLLNVLSGKDERDPTSAEKPAVDFSQALDAGVQDLVIGLPTEYLSGHADEEAINLVKQAARQLAADGAKLTDVSLVPPQDALAAYGVIAAAELSSSLARFDGVRYGHRSADAGDSVSMFANSRSEGFGEQIKLAILTGTYVLLAKNYDDYYLRATKVRQLVKETFAKAFAVCDVLVTPTVANFPGDSTDLYDMHWSHLYTIGASLAGLPAVSLPCGVVDGLPVGMQLIAPAWQEERLLATAYAWEQASGLTPLTLKGRRLHE